MQVELNIYGVPGQDRFKFMWDIVGVGMDGLFLLVDGTAPDTWPESVAVGEHFATIARTPIVVGVNRAAGQPDLVEKVRRAVPFDGALYLGCDVTDRDNARDALVELLFLILDELPDDDEDLSTLSDEDLLIEQARKGAFDYEASDVDVSATDPAMAEAGR
jgi:signal recognition particle receptor subunit beta